jgi:hypothetical protein
MKHFNRKGRDERAKHFNRVKMNANDYKQAA